MSDPAPAKPQRLLSLDALRGFDMFWITGGDALFKALAVALGYVGFQNLTNQQLDHVGWEGFVFYDLIFPLFVFMTGVTMPYTLTKRLEEGTPKSRLHGRVFRRFLILVLLGMAGDLLGMDWPKLRPFSVLGLIGCAYLIAGLIVIHRPPQRQGLWIVGLLLGYALALWFIPVPGFGAAQLTPGAYLGGYIDRHLYPGTIYQHSFDPEGTLCWFPAAAMALLGVQAGHLLRRESQPSAKLVGRFAVAGLLLVALGYGGSRVMPIIKAFWSPTYILVAGGWSLLLLALFYFLVDVLRLRWLCFFFVPIGMNAITIYLAQDYIDFGHTAERLFGGLSRQVPAAWGPVVLALGVLAIQWAILYAMFRKRIFIRV